MTRRIVLTLVGYLGTLALVGLGVYLWSHHVETRIEHRIDRIVIEGGKDRKRITALEHGRAAKGGDAHQTPKLPSAPQLPGPPLSGPDLP